MDQIRSNWISIGRTMMPIPSAVPRSTLRRLLPSNRPCLSVIAFLVVAATTIVCNANSCHAFSAKPATRTTSATNRVPTSVYERHHHRYSRSFSSLSLQVKDIDEWVGWSDSSLERLSGQSLLDRMEDIGTIQQVHSDKRFAVLSHDTQDDPIFCYFNQAALDTFGWPEPEIYGIPSRQSAPPGGVRQERSVLMQEAVGMDVRVLPTAIRQNKDGDRFQLRNVLVWNVYHPDTGERVGQTAMFDRRMMLEADQD